MEKFFKKVKDEIKMNNAEEKVFKAKMDIAWEKYGFRKQENTFPIFKKFVFLALSIFILIGVLLTIRPNFIIEKEKINILKNKPVSAKEVIKKMIFKAEQIKKEGNTAHIKYNIKTTNTNINNNYSKYIDAYYDLESPMYKIHSNQIFEVKKYNKVQKEDGSVVTVEQNPFSYNFYFNLKEKVTEQFETSNRDNGASLFIDKEYYPKLFQSMTPIDSIYENIKSFELILNSIDDNLIDEEQIDINEMQIEAFKISFPFKLEGWDNENHKTKIYSHQITIWINKESFLPIRQIIENIDKQQSIMITYDIIEYINLEHDLKNDFYSFQYENPKDTITYDFDQSNNKNLGFATIKGKVDSQFLGEIFTLGKITNEDGSEYLLDGFLMVDWDSAIPTTVTLFLIGKNVELQGLIIDCGYAKKLFVTNYKIL